MAEAVIGVGGGGGEAHAEQDDQAGEQVERGVGKAAEHRHRAGVKAAQPLSRTRNSAIATLACAARLVSAARVMAWSWPWSWP